MIREYIHACPSCGKVYLSSEDTFSCCPECYECGDKVKIDKDGNLYIGE